ncbi:hypothetical protein SDC9_55953 [bioreactor metagenome]|uniref:Uncharacterized protein n=1 Tax=bioreactor metagenome TaxID=1076179 RepID=A0A644X0I2_9ZZZZ
MALDRAFTGVDNIGLARGVAAVVAAPERTRAQNRGFGNRNRAGIARRALRGNCSVRGIRYRTAFRHFNGNLLGAVKRAARGRNFRLLGIPADAGGVGGGRRWRFVKQKRRIGAPVADVRMAFGYLQFIENRAVRRK